MKSNYWYNRLSRHWQRFLVNPYSHLFGSLLILFFAFAFLDLENNNLWGQVGLVSIVFVTVLFVIETFRLPRKFINPFRAIALLAYIFNLLAVYLEIKAYKIFYIVGQSIQLIFISVAVYLIIKKIFTDTQVTGDTLQGGISAYLMIGLVWFQIYEIILTINPNAFQGDIQSYQIFYFSFVTLTTVGYGDILPVHKTTMIMSNLEAIIGQLYPSIIIAKLVSIYVGKKLDEDQNHH